MEEFNQYQDIKYKSSKGIKWLGIAELFIRLFQFSATIILARLLMPQDFGVISIALIFTQLAYVLFDFGFSSALIQKKDITEKHYSTIFFVYLASAFVFTLIVFMGSPLAAAYFKQEILKGILNTLTLIFFFYA
ncbi:MAG: oligosaccharide flippase family protein, partial [Calditrichales bacterium]|nr:oligosaccharide flippase family protein [Calditrichales bacterium]